jgi:hypothetical protein
MADEVVAQNDTNVAPIVTPPAAQADAGSWRLRAEEAERELVLRRALQGIDWFDAEDAFRELSARTERDATGKWVVTGRGAATTTEDAARELAARKPHWVRARVFGGTGAGSGTPGGVAHSVSYAELLRPENAAKMREFIHERPEELERLRARHFGE